MDDFELFGTEEEALAFIRGYKTACDLIDDDHTFVGEADPNGDGEWRVNYGHHC